MSIEPVVRPDNESGQPHQGDQPRDVGAFGGKRLLGDLLVASGRHDEAAFARFYQLTSPWIFNLLRRWTGSIAKAEDATRLVYTTVWRRAPSFAPSNRSALAWVTTIAYEVVAP